MSKVVVSILATFLLFIVLSPIAYAQENFRANEIAILEKNEVINKDYFAWGEKVVLTGTVNGDAYIGGGNIIVDGVVNGDLLAAGGNINVLGKVSGDIRVAGGNINISGDVGGNVTSVGGNVNIEKGANISGSLVAGSGNVQVSGLLGKGATVGAGSLTLGNSVGSDVMVAVGKIDLSSNASVNGDITYISDEKIGLAKDASISGKITQYMPPKVDIPEKEGVSKVFSFGWNMYIFLTTLFVGIVLIILGANYTKRSASFINDKPLLSLGVGLLALVVIPVAVILFIISIIGIPVAILLSVYYVFLICFAKIFTALFIGQKVFGYLGQKNPNLFLVLTSGLIILSILSLVPIVGGIVVFLSVLFGVGGDILAKKELFLTLRAKKVV